MNKIPTLFVRDYSKPAPGCDFTITDQVTPGCEWVTNGEGVATIKWDGKAVKLEDGKWYVRRDVKTFTINKSTGERHEWNRQMPEGFIPLGEPDPVTGHWPGWVPADEKADKLIFETAATYDSLEDGTYELIGPKIGTRGGANPEKLDAHELRKHGDMPCSFGEPITLEFMRRFFEKNDYEGIVWHHPDGRMCKLKGTDFGIHRAERFPKMKSIIDTRGTPEHGARLEEIRKLAMIDFPPAVPE